MSARPAFDPSRDLRQTLRVRAVHGRQVVLAAQRASACGACAVKSGCAAAALAEMAQEDDLVLDFDQAAAVAPGDQVVVALPGASFLTAAALGYFVPIVVLVLGMALLSAGGLSDLVSAGIMLPVFALSFWPLWRAEQRERRAPALHIVEILPSEPQ